jgi:hypothetical protein
MAKVRIVSTRIVEFELNPDYYPMHYTVEQMAEAEAQRDIDDFMDCGDDIKIVLDQMSYRIIND